MSAELERAAGYTKPDVMKAVAGTVILALVLACVYGPIDYYSPLVYLNAVLAVMMGSAIGRSGKAMLRHFRIDGKGAALVVGVAGALAGLWFSWLTYLWVLFDFEFEVFGTFAAPSALWRVMEFLSENPVWELSSRSGKTASDAPGLLYWGVWLVEAGIFLYYSVKECRGFVATNTLCPQCREWLRETGDEVRFEVPEDESFMTDVAAGDLSFLEKLPRLHGDEVLAEGETERKWLTATSHACGKCEGLNAHVVLSLSIATRDKKKEPQVTTVVIANMAEISPELETALFLQPKEEDPAPAAATEPEQKE